MVNHDPTLIMRLGDRSGDLRVEGHTYGIDVRLYGSVEYGLTIEQAKLLRNRLTQVIAFIENTDETTYENGDKA